MEQKKVLEAISNSLTVILEHDNLKDVCQIVVKNMMECLDSTSGFVAELKYSNTGSPFFRYRGVQAKEIIETFNSYYQKNFVEKDTLDFYNMDTLYGLVYQTKEVVISNDVYNDPRRGGHVKLPPNHPPIHRFLGIPLKHNEQLIGIIGLANSPRDYTLEDVKQCESFINLFIFIIIECRRRNAINNSRNRFLLHMSHEIKTPLNGIIGMTQHILDTELSIEQLDILECISQCNLRMLTIVNDIGDFYKISMGHIELEQKSYNLNEIIKEVYELYRSDVQQKNINFQIDISTEIDGDIITDKKRLMQILFNIISNSIKYTHRGSISIKVFIKDSTPDNCHLQFEITDTGIGITAEKLELIFHDFNNIDNGLVVNPDTGRGLGLSICRLLVKTFKGHIEIDSQVGLGTKVIFTIETKLNNNIDYFLGYLKTHLGKSYALGLINNDEDRIRLSNMLLSLKMIPIISNTEIEARMYVETMNLNFKVLIVSKEHTLDDIIMDAKTKINDIIIVSISHEKVSPIIDFYTGFDFQENMIIEYLYNNIRKSRDELENLELNQLPKQILSEQKDVMNNLYKSSSHLHKSLSDADLKNNNKIKILVAEDEITNQKVIEKVLIKLGYTNIKFVMDGQLMVDAVSKEDYHIIFIDIRMPVMDGYTATRHVVSNLLLEGRNIPMLIAVTALEDIYMQQHCTEAGIHYVLKKPYNFEDINKIMKLVKKKEEK